MYRIKLNKNIDTSIPAIATIGNFDGMHIGHFQLFKQLNCLSQEYNYRRIAITFEPLPLEYFSDLNQQSPLLRLSLLRDKFNFLLKKNLVDELVVLNFNASIANLSPKDFISQLLQQSLNVSCVFVGHDFKFGKNASGNREDFIQNNIKVYDMPPFYLDNKRVSSSMIREYAAKNQLKDVYKFLGHNISYTSKIVYGNQLGRKFGVPTINLSLGKIRPALCGIYIGYVYIEEMRYNGVISIGKNPTVSEVDNYKLEAHLLDIDANLYGKIAVIEILQFMRLELKFENLDSLFEQIHQDLQNARNYFKQFQNQQEQ